MSDLCVQDFGFTGKSFSVCAVAQIFHNFVSFKKKKKKNPKQHKTPQIPINVACN